MPSIQNLTSGGAPQAFRSEALNLGQTPPEALPPNTSRLEAAKAHSALMGQLSETLAALPKTLADNYLQGQKIGDTTKDDLVKRAAAGESLTPSQLAIAGIGAKVEAPPTALAQQKTQAEIDALNNKGIPKAKTPGLYDIISNQQNPPAANTPNTPNAINDSLALPEKLPEPSTLPPAGILGGPSATTPELQGAITGALADTAASPGGPISQEALQGAATGGEGALAKPSVTPAAAVPKAKSEEDQLGIQPTTTEGLFIHPVTKAYYVKEPGGFAVVTPDNKTSHIKSEKPVAYTADTKKLMSQSGYVPEAGEPETSVTANARLKMVAADLVPPESRIPYMRRINSLQSNPVIKEFYTARSMKNNVDAALKDGLTPAAGLAVIDSFTRSMSGGRATVGMTSILAEAQTMRQKLELLIQKFKGTSEENAVLTPELAGQIHGIINRVHDAAKKEVEEMQEGDVESLSVLGIPAGATRKLYKTILTGRQLPSFGGDETAPAGVTGAQPAASAAPQAAKPPEDPGAATAQKMRWIDVVRKTYEAGGYQGADKIHAEDALRKEGITPIPPKVAPTVAGVAG